MREKADVTRGWLRKAASDVTAMEASFQAGSLDAACFHAQQAAEKYLKAFLVHAGASFPFTHNLAKLVEVCASIESEFKHLLPAADCLTPYAVQVRYDQDFWPSVEDANEALSAAHRVREFVVQRLPQG